MSKRILKYRLESADGVVEIRMPKGANIISVVLQMNVGCVIWVEADESRSNEVRKFALLRTGNNIPRGSKFLTTINTAIPIKNVGESEFHLKPIVWHVYELDVMDVMDGVTILENLNMN